MKKYENYLFLLFLVVISLLYNYQNIITQPPYSTHQWRQADGFSIALNYYEEGMNLLEPKIHFQESEKGKAVGEFPIIYYLDAAIWKITGISYFIIRLINILITFFGLFALFKISSQILKDTFYSYIIPLLIFSSALFAFYANNFLVNVPALSCIFIGWYFLLKYVSGKHLLQLIFSIIFFTLAILLRSTMVIGLIPVYILILLEFFGLLKANFSNKKYFHLSLLFIPLILAFIWYLFSINYNKSSNSVYFLMSIRPIWETENIPHFWSKLINSLLPEFFHSSIIYILLLILATILLTIKKHNKYLLITTLAITVQLIIYILLWFNNLDVHDYYLIELFLFVPAAIICFLYYIKKEHLQIFNSKIFKSLIILVLILSFGYTTSKIRIKYSSGNRILTKVFISEDEINFWNWYHWDYNNNFKAVETIKPYLRSLGIKRNDIIISVPDPSPNITLSLMDQKGFTSLYYNDLSTSDRINLFISKGAKYLIINNPIIYEDSEILPFTENKIGSYKNVDIYRLY